MNEENKSDQISKETPNEVLGEATSEAPSQPAEQKQTEYQKRWAIKDVKQETINTVKDYAFTNRMLIGRAMDEIVAQWKRKKKRES